MSFADKKLTFCGAGIFRQNAFDSEIWSPRTTLGKIVERALGPLGYEIEIDLRGFGQNNSSLVANGEADLGALGADWVSWAYHGAVDFAGQKPLSNLRVIATVNFPAWMGIAARWETGIIDLAQIRERKMPARIVGATGLAGEIILAHHGLSREQIEAWGGRFLRGMYLPLAGWVTSGDFDVIIDPVYAAYTPEARHWWEASVLHNLRFLPMSPELIKRLVDETGAEPGSVPHQLMRGVNGDIPSVCRPPHAIYGRDDTPDELAYLLAKTLDERRELFRQVFIPFSYDPRTVAQNTGTPLHPGAERYYREVGYPVGNAVAAVS